MQRVLLALAAGCVVFTVNSPTRADDQTEAKCIVERAIKAHGGVAKLTKLTATIWKVKGTFHGPMGAKESRVNVPCSSPERAASRLTPRADSVLSPC